MQSLMDILVPLLNTIQTMPPSMADWDLKRVLVVGRRASFVVKLQVLSSLILSSSCLPQGFLTAMRQEITRAHKGWALDNVALANDVTKMMKEDVSSSPPEGVYVQGLFLDGAGWDRRNCRLTEPLPKVLFTALPVVHIFAVNSASMVKDSKDNKDVLKFYECPVYKKPRRTDLTYIFCLNLKTSQHPDHWILRGVALLCDTK